MRLGTGTKLGPFEILAPLGAGGMGEVYRARDTRLGREVALKVLPADLMSDREKLIRFAQEARSASALNHPNIVTIFEIGQAEGSPFMAMELIAGKTLRELLDAGPMSIKRSLALATQMADGLAKAHEAGIVHRDLKPENVMVTNDGFVKILDFGLAKLAGPMPGAGSETQQLMNQSMTKSGFVLGTAGYMSPEQASGHAVDFRSDQFSAGLIFYEMLASRRAFHRATAIQTLSAIIQDEVEPLDRVNPRVPPPFKWIVDRCLAKEPDERYGSTRDLSRDLRQVRDNLGMLETTGSQSRSTTSSRSTTTVASAAGAALTQMTPLPAAETAATALLRASAPTPVVRSKGRRAAELAGLLAIGLALFGGGATGGFWFRGQQADPAPTSWKGELLLGATSRVMAPRVSPDGQALAFLTLVNGVSQVAVMKPSSGDWTVLTKQRGAGSAYKVDWSRDGSRLYFDRVSDLPHGIFSVPALGGDERMVLEGAQGPEALPDGSLLVVKRDARRDFQLHRFFPETGKDAPVGPAIVPESLGLTVRAFPDGASAVFWGKLVDERVRRAYVLDLATGKVAPFAPELPLAPPLGLSGDGKSVVAFLVAGDLMRAVSVSRDGQNAASLLAITGKPWYVDMAADGTLYVDTMDNPAELIRFPTTGGAPERVASTAGNLVMSPVQFPDGRLLVPSQILGKKRLLVATGQGELRPLLDVSEQASPPAAVVGEKLLAFLSGGVGKPSLLALASLAEGRIVKRLEASSGIAPQSLSASPDGKTLYYADGGSIFALDVENGTPRRLRAGNGVAVDARGPSLIVQMNESDAVKLYRSPMDGSAAEPLPFQSPLRLAPSPLSGSAVGPDGRIAVTVTSKDSWFRSPALLDPANGGVEKVAVAYEGDVLNPSWGRDGSLLAMGVSLRSALWRFRPAEAAAQKKP